mmetsp:Transcript_20517/g.54389  ORF Transcript_20517/g.54389 Transcript_20517/m.54389 type:complete len:215 (+) Transcript_20517:338-982(+)
MPAQLSAGGQLHDGLHDVVVVGLEGLDGLRLGALDLRHDELDVLGLDAGLVHLVAVVLGVLHGHRLGLRRRVAAARAGHLRRGLGLGRRAEVLDLRLAEDNVRVRVRRLVDVRLGDHEEDVLALLHGDAGDARHRLHPQLLHRLAALLLGPVLLRRPGPAARCLKVGHVLIGVIVAARLLNLGVGLRLGHCCRRSEGAGEATGRVPAMSTALSA